MIEGAAELEGNEDYEVVGLPHRTMEVVRDQQHSAAKLLPNGVDELVEQVLSCRVDPLGRFVQHHQVRSINQHACQEQPLKLAARQRSNLWIPKLFKPYGPKCVVHLLLGESARQVDQTPNRERQGGIECQSLGDIANLH